MTVNIHTCAHTHTYIHTHLHHHHDSVLDVPVVVKQVAYPARVYEGSMVLLEIGLGLG